VRRKRVYMGKSLEGPPQSIIRDLANSNPGTAAKALGQLFNWADSRADRGLARRSVRLMRAAIRSAKAALPDTEPELIGGFFANVLDLWETGQKLDKELRDLAKLHLPQDRQRLRGILIWLDAIQVDMASYWIREVRKDMPKLLKALDQQERNGHRRVASKATRRTKKAAGGRVAPK
jgi:hypothetical protein